MMKKRITTFGLCALAAASSGCSSWSKSTAKTKDSPWSISHLWKKEYQQPQSIAAIWAPDVLTLPGKPATRGFGGRIYFYNERSQAVPVDGDLMVHGYLRHSRAGESEQVAADKTFGFTAEQLTTHFSPSEMGASYSVWIPWDAADGMRSEVTLIPTFKGKDGTIVQGSPAKVNLPGKSDLAKDSKPGSLMQTVAFSRSSTATNPGFEPAATMRTTTINVPPNSTLAKPKQIQAFTLGSAPNGPSVPAGPTPGATGVSLGGSNAAALPHSHPGTPTSRLETPAHPAVPLLTPPAGGFRPVDLKHLTPPPMPDARAFSRAVPIEPPSTAWSKPSSEVQAASFSR